MKPSRQDNIVTCSVLHSQIQLWPPLRTFHAYLPV